MEDDIHTGLHIVYKRQDHAKHLGDYGKLFQMRFTYTLQPYFLPFPALFLLLTIMTFLTTNFYVI